MGRRLDASGWRWSSDSWARTNQHRQDSARGFSDYLKATRVFSAEQTLAPLYAAYPQLKNNLDAVSLRELDKLVEESDPEIFFQGLLAFGARLESRNHPALAADLYSLCAVQAIPALSATAQSRLDALQGRGPWARRAEGFLKNFAATTTDPRTILPMLAGTAVYRMVRAAALFRLSAAPATWYTRGPMANFHAGLFGFAAEVPSFALGSRVLWDLSGASLPWDLAAVNAELRDAAITLGALKLSAHAAKLALASPRLPATARSALPGVAQFAGLWAAHRWTGQPAGFGDILGSLISLSVGGHLGNRLIGPRYANFQMELLQSHETPRPSHPNFLPWNDLQKLQGAYRRGGPMGPPTVGRWNPNSSTRGRSHLAFMDSKGADFSPTKYFPAYLAKLPLQEIYATLLSDWMGENVELHPSILPYKLGILHQAIRIKRGEREFTTWEDVLQSVGFQQADKLWRVTETTLGDYFLTHLEPLLRNLQWEKQGQPSELLSQGIRFFAGDMEALEATDYLREGFDRWVDGLSQAMERAAHPEGAARSPADQAVILGHYSRAAHNLLEDPEANFFPLWRLLLGYAERAETDDAVRSYARLRAALQTLSQRKSSDSIAWGCALCDVAASLYRAGRAEAARDFIAQALGEGLPWIDFRVLDILSKFQDIPRLDGLLTAMRREAVSQWEALHAEIQRDLQDLSARYGPAAHTVEEYSAKSELPDFALDFPEANRHLEHWLAHPELYRDALFRLNDFPSGAQALELYRQAAVQIPKDFTDAERKELAQRYWKVLREQKAAYHEVTMRSTSLVPSEDFFEASRFYYRHSLMVADIYLTAVEPETRRLGLDFILRELSRENNEQTPVAFGGNVMLPDLEISRPDPAVRFLPILWRIDAVLNRLKHFPSGSRKRLLRESFETLKQLRTRGENSLNRATLLSELATAAFRYGDDALAQEVIAAWDQGLEKKLERSLGKATPGELNPREFWPAIRSEARLLFEVVQALGNGEAGMEGFLSRLEKASPTRRTHSLEDYLLALDYLGREEVVSQLAKRDAALERFSREIVLRYAEAPLEDRSRLWTSLISALQNLPTSVAVMDQIFLNLLKRATPFQKPSHRRSPPAPELWRAYRPLAFLIANPDFPSSEAYLLEQLAKSLRGDHGSDAVLILSELDWAFIRLRNPS